MIKGILQAIAVDIAIFLLAGWILVCSAGNTAENARRRRKARREAWGC